MLSPFICGAFHHEEEEDEAMTASACSTPRKSKRNGLSSRTHNSKGNKNPYSSRGLDKFSALLADLEQKRQKIYAETGAQDISFVRFVYKNSDDCVPIVIKLKDKKDEKSKVEDVKANNKHVTEVPAPTDKFLTETSTAVKDDKQSRLSSDKYKSFKKSFSRNYLKMIRWNRPSFYLPVFVILILLFLAVFGRSVTILCTSIGWYMVPTLNESIMRKRSLKKKEYVRKLSEPKVVVSDRLSSPKTNHSGAVKDKSPRQQLQQKSW
ncbi:hypothetical protein FNV43_RR11726 [Rhamnella rubrinervis]|uniref:ZCF37 n=1 Tax=Rhamnella rubrinervis TaxID=2594499 RepID=A0A8K0H6B6_9ROSA|nr:hypothetical protein FNV43_RR11726 [Rhamnella rubrinervis]